jgi:hypothetical protein
MADDITVPKVGKVPKKVIIPIVVGAGGFVAWRYYVARNTTGGDTAADAGYDDPGTLPGVAGAVRPDGDYGSGVATPAATSDYGFTGTTNAQWSQYATAQLQQGDRWPYNDIVTALGNYLDSRPLSSLHQDIVRAAIAVAGMPPVGYHSIVPGGNTALTVAPSGLRATATPTTINVTFTGVSGATTYNAYRSNTTGTTTYAAGSSSSSPMILTGLQPNTTYTVQIAGVSASGAVGPRSAAVTVKTPGVNLATPATPSVSLITKTSAFVKTNAVPHANGYNWYNNGRIMAHTDSPNLAMTRLTSRATYKVTVAADSSSGAPSRQSGAVTFKTK